MEIGKNLFIHKGPGWINMKESDEEISELKKGAADNSHLEPITLSEDDMEQRIRLAGLSPPQVTKYKCTLDILELTQRGLRTSEIAKRLEIKPSKISTFIEKAPETIEKVEEKIDKYEKTMKNGQWTDVNKTISTNARHSLKSIWNHIKKLS